MEIKYSKQENLRLLDNLRPIPLKGLSALSTLLLRCMVGVVGDRGPLTELLVLTASFLPPSVMIGGGTVGKGVCSS